MTAGKSGGSKQKVNVVHRAQPGRRVNALRPDTSPLSTTGITGSRASTSAELGAAGHLAATSAWRAKCELGLGAGVGQARLPHPRADSEAVGASPRARRRHGQVVLVDRSSRSESTGLRLGVEAK